MKPIITVFTPTYNRKELIHKCYESLKRQTSKSFRWLIIDDGSTDNTKELIMQWKKEANFQIDYIYKKNGGMHSAHNTAYENIETELNVCIDSDDYMTDDGIEKIIRAWEERRADHVAGIAALDLDETGQIIGTKFPEELKEATLFDTYHRYGVKGDKKLIYRTELTKDYPYPEFEDERYVGLAYKCHKIDEKYKLALVNEPVCIVEYRSDGSTKNMFRQYRNNPKGWCFYRLENLKISNTSLMYKFKECAHYISSSLIVGDKAFLRKSPHKILTLGAFPLGCILYSYVMYSTRGKSNC